MRGDLSVIGLQVSFPVRVAASATRYEAGEPLHSLAALTTGTADVNTYVLAAADSPVIGTHKLGGVAKRGAEPRNSTATLVAHWSNCARPVAYNGILRGKAEVPGSVDTLTELVGILQDVSLIDYNATGGTDGGELYTLKEADSGADTSGLEFVGGNVAVGTLDAVVLAAAYDAVLV